ELDRGLMGLLPEPSAPRYYEHLLIEQNRRFYMVARSYSSPPRWKNKESMPPGPVTSRRQHSTLSMCDRNVGHKQPHSKQRNCRGQLDQLQGVKLLWQVVYHPARPGLHRQILCLSPILCLKNTMLQLDHHRRLLIAIQCNDIVQPEYFERVGVLPELRQ